MFGFSNKDPKRINIEVSKSELRKAFNITKQVMYSHGLPDHDEKCKNTMVIRSVGDDLVLSVGIDGINAPEMLFSTIVKEGACRNDCISSCIFHNELESALNKCGEKITISGHINDDTPLFINEYKIRRKGVVPFEVGNVKYQFRLQAYELMAKINKLWDGFQYFAFDVCNGEFKIHSFGIPKKLETDKMGPALAATLRLNNVDTGFLNFFASGNVKGLKSINLSIIDPFSHIDVSVCSSGITMIWNSGMSMVVMKNSRYEQILREAAKTTKDILDSKSYGFMRYQIYNSAKYHGKLNNGIGWANQSLYNTTYLSEVFSYNDWNVSVNSDDGKFRIYVGDKNVATTDYLFVLYSIGSLNEQVVGITPSKTHIGFIDGSDIVAVKKV